MKKLIAVLLTAVLLSVPALAATPIIEKVNYEGNGFIEIDFQYDVQYLQPAVTVKDFTGTEYATIIYERDDDDLTFRAEGLVSGESYEITVSGIRYGYSGAYEAISDVFTLPETGVPAIKKVEYDEGELEIEFVEKVSFLNPTLEVTDLNGTVYQSFIAETEGDSIEAYVKGLNFGDTYLLRISGVALRGTDAWLDASAEFVAWDD